MAKRSKITTKVQRRDETSAGGLVWRHGPAGEIEVALVKPAGKDFWALPKGHVEEGESIQDTAVREVREETGLIVSEVRPLGDISYIFSHHEDAAAPLVRIFKRVHFFLMEMQGGDMSAHDAEIDAVEWVGLDEAIKRASFDNERKLIAKAAGILRPGARQSQAR